MQSLLNKIPTLEPNLYFSTTNYTQQRSKEWKILQIYIKWKIGWNKVSWLQYLFHLVSKYLWWTSKWISSKSTWIHPKIKIELSDAKRLDMWVTEQRRWDYRLRLCEGVSIDTSSGRADESKGQIVVLAKNL